MDDIPAPRGSALTSCPARSSTYALGHQASKTLSETFLACCSLIPRHSHLGHPFQTYFHKNPIPTRVPLERPFWCLSGVLHSLLAACPCPLSGCASPIMTGSAPARGCAHHSHTPSRLPCLPPLSACHRCSSGSPSRVGRMPCHEKPLLSTVVLWYWCTTNAQQRNNATAQQHNTAYKKQQQRSA